MKIQSTPPAGLNPAIADTPPPAAQTPKAKLSTDPIGQSLSSALKSASAIVMNFVV